MANGVKSFIKSAFRVCGFEVKRAPRFGPYQWLKEMHIRTILDIGANTGQFASQIHRVLPEATLYSFEPLKDCYDKLCKTMRGVYKFSAFNYALGDTTGQTQIYRNDSTPSSSLLPMEELHKQAFPFTAQAAAQKIEIRRLDDIAGQLEIIDNLLIKIDVQGTEDKVILGGEKLISRASILIVETSFRPLYKSQPLFDNIYDLLKRHYFVYMGTEHIIRNPNDGSILQCDSVFMRHVNC